MERMEGRTLVAPLVAPLATGAAGVVAAAYLAANDPAAPGNRFPGCVLHELTGLWCPGCGLTRGTHALLRGDVAGAIATNAFTPLVAVALAAAWWSWFRRAAGRPRRSWWAVPRGWAGALVTVAVVVYGVLRNVPGLDALAP